MVMWLKLIKIEIPLEITSDDSFETSSDVQSKLDELIIMDVKRTTFVKVYSKELEDLLKKLSK